MLGELLDVDTRTLGIRLDDQEIHARDERHHAIQRNRQQCATDATGLPLYRPDEIPGIGERHHAESDRPNQRNLGVLNRGTGCLVREEQPDERDRQHEVGSQLRAVRHIALDTATHWA